MKQFCLSLFPVGISAWLMTMFLLMIMSLSTDGIEISVEVDEHMFNQKLPIKKTNTTITVEVNETDKVEDLKKKIMGALNDRYKAMYGNDPTKVTLLYGQNDDILNDGTSICDIPITNDLRLSMGQFKIKVQYGKTEEVKYSIWVNSKETVAILKKKIKIVSEIEPERQTLTYTLNDQSLDDDKKTLKHYDIDSLKFYGQEYFNTITLSPEFKITVKADEKITKESNQITVLLKHSANVKELKERIKEATGIEPKRQTLQFKTPEITVEVDGWDKMNDLMEMIIEKLPANIETKHGFELKKLTLQYGRRKDNDMLNDAKTMDDYPIKQGAFVHLSIGEFEIVVRFESKFHNEVKNYTIWVNGKETVATLKKKIEIESGIDPDTQTLQLKQNGAEIEDEKTWTDYGIGNGTIIYLSVDKFKVLVKYRKENEEKQYTFVINSKDTVATLKEMIKNETGIETGGQTLKLKNPDGIGTDIELEDDQILIFWCRSTVHLSFEKFQILLKYQKGDEEKQYTVWVNGMDTVAKLKQKIKNWSGIEVEGQTLKLKNPNGSVTELEDRNTMTHYGIGKGSTILLSKKFKITVKDERKKPMLISFINTLFTVEVNGTDTVNDLKKKLTRNGSDHKRLTLKYGENDEILEGKKTIGHYPITKGDIIHLSSSI
ncbi:hypothetical protein niasHT_025203 [Heterodera trifolii]|uniref:Ubiquitin-like domain-containing protein n=1 Tax=Heterodera trifolii TaxID=157864 RepID=A0ABD2JLF3_9BILA